VTILWVPGSQPKGSAEVFMVFSSRFRVCTGPITTKKTVTWLQEMASSGSNDMTSMPVNLP
jgi:hypothetical protein